jgi:hypothetical protein
LLVHALWRDQTRRMIDIRDREATIATLRAARRAFARGAPVPLAARELLRALVDGLADSGPLELDVTSARWLGAVRSAERGAAYATADRSRNTVRRAKRSLRRLELFFAGKQTWWGRLTQWSAVAIVAMIPLGIVGGSHDKLTASLWVAAVIGAFVGLEAFTRRYRPPASKATTCLGLPDRQLLALSVNASRADVRSLARAKLGAYVHPVLIATDRRLVLARPGEVPSRSAGNEYEFAWELTYADVTSFWSTRTGGESPREVVTVQSRERTVGYELAPADGKALVAIIERRLSGTLRDARVAGTDTRSLGSLPSH